MITRSRKSSQIHPIIEEEHTPLYEVDIDFDDASECWRENKKSTHNGMFVYVCGTKLQNGNKCQRSCCKDETKCFQHK